MNYAASGDHMCSAFRSVRPRVWMAVNENNVLEAS